MNIKKIIDNKVLHPILFAVYPVLFLYSTNISELYAGEIFTPLLLILGITISFWAGLYFILKKKSKKSGVAVTVFLLFFFSYGHIYNIIQRSVSHTFMFILWCFLIAGSLFLILKSKKDFNKSNKILNFISIVLILLSLINIFMFALKEKSANRNVAAHNIQTTNTVNNSSNVKNKPDIYFIIPDGYTSNYNLKKYYNFNNKKFIKFLKSKGFYLANKSVPNYSPTYISLSATLNMKHMYHLKKVMGKKSRNVKYFYNMVRNNKVMRFLKSKGYRFIHLGDGKGETAVNPYADIDYRFADISEFSMFLLQTTMLRPFENKFIDDITRVHKQIKKTKEIITMSDKPKFVLVHLFLPHPPLQIDRNGNRLPIPDMKKYGSDWLPRNRYVEQVLYTNKLLKGLISKIISKSQKHPIIIIQGDHGPYIEKQKKEKFYKERMGIFNAIYAAEEVKNKLYQNMTPVNTFAFIFNHYFKTKFKIKKDRSFFSRYSTPYNFIEITDLIRNAQNN